MPWPSRMAVPVPPVREKVAWVPSAVVSVSLVFFPAADVPNDPSRGCEPAGVVSGINNRCRTEEVLAAGDCPLVATSNSPLG